MHLKSIKFGNEPSQPQVYCNSQQPFRIFPGLAAIQTGRGEVFFLLEQIHFISLIQVLVIILISICLTQRCGQLGA